MKIDAEVKWNMSDDELMIHNGSCELVRIDADYVEASEDAVVEYVVNELYDIYGKTFGYANVNMLGVESDFTITNIDDVLADLMSFSEENAF